jgi:alpha/beta superfamily hydrolase
MTETPFFFKNNDYRLYGVLHAPDERGPLIGQKHGVVFCSPFGEEKMFSHRVYVNMARSLAREGVACLRFDFMGEGDSEGTFEESTIETRLSDIKAALDFLAEKTDLATSGLIGVRFGATLAALAATRNRVDTLALISPIVSGQPYMDLCLRSNLTTQMAAYKRIIKDRDQLIAELMEGTPVNIDGYLVGKDLYEQMTVVDLQQLNSILTERMIFITIGKGGKPNIDQKLSEFIDKCKGMEPDTTVQIADEEPFWKDAKIHIPVKRELNALLVKWLSGGEAT